MGSNNKFKVRVFNRDKFICFYCKEDLSYAIPSLGTDTCIITVDHVIPKMKGGTNDMRNLVTSCKSCNQEKAKKEYYQVYKQP